MQKWFKMQVREDDGSVADIFITDVIGDWVDEMINQMFGEDITLTAKAFVDELSRLPESVRTLRVHINSPGGDVAAAVQIANALRDQRATKGRRVETIVDGMAASAASLIAMAGDPARMADNAILMIHNPWTVGMGSSEELRKSATVLDEIRSAMIIPTYQWQTDLSADAIAAMMDAETWMSADEALEAGFVSEKVEGLRAAASISAASMRKLRVPERFASQVAALLRVDAVHEAPAPAPAPVVATAEPAKAPASVDPTRVLALCAEAELGTGFALQLVETSATEAEVRARIAGEVEARASKRAAAEAEKGRQDGIRAVCAKFKTESLAPVLIRSGATLADAAALVGEVKALTDRVEIESGILPGSGNATARRKPTIDYKDVYSRLNKAAQ